MSHFDTSNYCHSDRLRDLISDNPKLLMVISRFGIPLGFGDARVEDVCRDNGVDCPTFLAVANFMSHHNVAVENVDPAAMMGYLRRAHSYFLDFILPNIRRKLIEAINYSDSGEISMLIIKFFDEYYAEVRNHMEFENKNVFRYVDGLLSGHMSDNYNITLFASHHDHIDARLKELKDIIIRYYPGEVSDLLNSVLYDIISCEDDLDSHCSVEDRLFVPAVKALEHRVMTSEPMRTQVDDEDQAEADGRMEQLSAREKEIVACIAQGMSNKEIAASLNISIHTVTTHRRNISSKLSIHSPAGLTIFAIVNKLVKLSDLSIPRED